MFELLFENRNKTIGSVIKLGDFLGRSLRENTILLDLQGNKASYLTQEGKIISGDYSLSENSLKLSNIKIEDSNFYNDKDKLNKAIQSKLSTLIESVQNDKLDKADNAFQDVLNIWEINTNFNKRSKDFYNKLALVKESTNILDTDEFIKLMEITPKLTEYLKENKDKIIKVSEIINGVKLSYLISEAFNIKTYEYKDLEGKSVSFDINESTQSVYDMICRQELVKKELLESKKVFDSMWINNKKFNDLVGSMYAKDNEIEKCIAEAVVEIPYFALASKKEIYNTIVNILELNEGNIPNKDIKSFVSKIFEIKKPIRKELVRLLTEKYGINIANLKTPPSFNSLLNTQIVVFESLARLSPKSSVQREVLSKFSKVLKEKTGIQSLDINDYLQDLFTNAKYTETLVENISLMKFLDFQAIAKELGDVTSVIQMLKTATATPGQPGDVNAANAPAQGEDAANPPVGGMPAEEDSGEMGQPAGDGQMPAPETNLQPQAQGNEFNSDPSLGSQTMPVDLNQLALQLKELEVMLSDLGLTGKDLLPGDEEYGEAGDMPMPEEGGLGGEMGEEGIPGEEGGEEAAFGEQPGEEAEGDAIDQEQEELEGEEDELEARHGEVHDEEDELEKEEEVVRGKEKKLEKKEDSFKPKKKDKPQPKKEVK